LSLRVVPSLFLSDCRLTPCVPYYTIIQQFVVVCPSSLVSNWANEFDKWLGRAGEPKRVVLHKGGESSVSKLKAFVGAMKQQQGLHKIKKNGQVLIISYDLFRMNVETLSAGVTAQTFGLLAVDEGHRLKNASGSLTLTALESLPADARLCLTATPIQNNLSEFHALANFCRPGCLGDLASFRKEYERPIQLLANSTGSSSSSSREHSRGVAQSQALENVTKGFVIRRLQKDVLKSMLPPRTEALLFCLPSERQCELYRAITKPIQEGSLSAMADALPALTALRKVCCHPNLYKGACGAEDGGTCNVKRDASTGGDGASPRVELSGKLVVLEALLRSIRRHAPADKVVVVSNYTSALSVVESLVLQPNGFPSLRLDGSVDVQKRQTLVDTFNRTSDSFCFLLSSKAGGVGLNLIGANRLVLMDPDWNPANDIQAMGRVYRQGQTKSTTIYRLFTSGTIEEVIYQRQLQKGNLAALTVDGVCGKPMVGKQGFTQDELNDCFTLKEGCDCDTKSKPGISWEAYDGPDSLRLQRCFDLPLLEVAADDGSSTCGAGPAKALGYVHIVDDDDGSKISLGAAAAASESLYESDNEQEMEFCSEVGVSKDGSKSAYNSDDEEECEF